MTEHARLSALASYDILDTPPERDFDEVAALASEICGTPIAVVNLIDAGRQFFKAEVGLGVRSTPLESSFCAKAILEEDFLVVSDATKDPRFDGNPLVTGEPGLRFYAGALLKTDEGHAIGTVCVLDFQPRSLTGIQERTLRVLARQVMKQLDLRRTAKTQAEAVILLRENRERLGIADERLRMALDASGVVGLWDWMIDTDLLHGDANFARLYGLDVEKTASGVTMEEYQAFVVPEDLGSLREAIRSTFEEGADFLVEYRLAVPGQELRWIECKGRLIARQNGTAERFSGTAVDVTEKKQAVARQQFLNQELGHRLKNTLAMVQAIATQTLKGVTEHDAVAAFDKRIHAIAAAHEVLLQQSWSAAPIEAVVHGVLGTFAMNDRFEVSGPRVSLGPPATLSLSMLLHELATNALKYGALSSETGRVRTEWRLVGHNEEAALVFDWAETGGPAVRQPERKGFGSRLIGMGLGGTGGTELRYLPHGFEAEFKAPLSHLQRS